MNRRKKSAGGVPPRRAGFILLFLFISVLLLVYFSTQSGSYDNRASAYPPTNQSQAGTQGNSCQFWCAGCEGFCGDEGVRQGKICNVQQFERCGQLPCYVTGTCSPNGRGTQGQQAGSTATPRPVAAQTCPCGGALCGSVHDNVDVCRKVVCTDEGWKDLGSATNRACQPGSADNGTCGDTACSNGETLLSCASDCASLLTAPGNVARMVGPASESVEAIPASFSNPFFSMIARFYNLSPYELLRLFSGGVRSLVNFLQEIAPQQGATQPQTTTTVAPQATPTDPPEELFQFSSSRGCIPSPSGVTISECLEQAEDYNHLISGDGADPNEGTYNVVGGECLPQRGTLNRAACELLIMPLPGQ